MTPTPTTPPADPALDDETRALIIEMRRYIIWHQIPLGECVAWHTLKERYGIGWATQTDEAWLADYRARSPRPALDGTRPLGIE